MNNAQTRSFAAPTDLGQSSRMIRASLLFPVACLLMLTACAGRTVPDQPVDTTITSQRDPWICEPGATLDEWHCVRSSAAPAGAGTPARLRQLLAEQQPQEAAPLPAEAPPPPALPEDDQPDYERLAFRPEQATSILDLPGEYWTVQLIAMTSAEGLENYAEANGLQGFSAARIASGGDIYYVLLLGIYQSEEDAKLAVASMPDQLHDLSPWVRSVASLQRAMRAADSARQT